jgi:hypothetical protein
MTGPSSGRGVAVSLGFCGVAMALLGGFQVVPWIALAPAPVLAAGLASRTPGTCLEDLERQLMRCRRRDEEAAALVARMYGWRGSSEDLLASFRLTDSIALRRFGSGVELVGVFERNRFDPSAVERRLQHMVGEAELHVAWANFPQDGVTLQVLLEGARSGLPALAGRRRGRRLATERVPATPFTFGGGSE